MGPEQLSAAERVVTPELATNAAGDVVVVWDREEGEVCADAPDNPACVHIVETLSRVPGSSSWQPAVEIARPGVGSGPRVAVDPAGNAVVVWSHDIGEPRVLQAAYRRGRSGPWDFAIDLSDERFRAGTQRIAMDAAGNVIAAWAGSGAAGLVVQAAVRDAESGVWGPPVDVSRRDSGALGGPSLAVGAGGDAVVAWVRADGRVLASHRPPGGPWQAPAEVSRAEWVAIPDVDVAVNAVGDSVAAWSALGGRGAVVQSAFRSEGAPWGAAADIAITGRAESRAPHVGLDPAGNAHVVWLGQGNRNIVHASTRVPATGWSPPVEISARERDVREPRLAVDAVGNAVAVWTDAEGVTHAAIRPALGLWQPATDLSRPNEPTGGVRVAMGPVGDALAVWSRFEPRRVRVEASELRGGGPVLGVIVVPAAGTAGAVISMSVEPRPWRAPLAGEPTWSFGDGASASGASVRHAFERPGRYTVSITQADASGATSRAEAAITITARPPANVARPSVLGRPRVGATLTCRRGMWTGTPPIRFRYAWLRNGRVAVGRTAREYRVRGNDRGALISCRVTATNAAGSRSSASRPLRIRR